MQTGEYQLAIGVVGKDPTKPLVKIGIKGKSEDGWYLLSELTILK
jgi:hypothetical protein